MSLMDDIRKMRETGLLPSGQPLSTAPTGGTWAPNPHYTGDASPPMFYQENAPLVAPPPPTPAAPPQLPQQASSAADFANRQSPELAQLQALMSQRQMPQLPQQARVQLPPQAMRGMMQNGMFAGASGGLPQAAMQNPQMNPVQLMQLLSQFGLMGRGTGGGVM